ncbi:hypothetical protein [uncultured Corynebacterium sp.]|uniref:hypothetical protein n=1 Tax=uncultured Corynebacterium sp. TaxID=159447 RepID=UPI0025D9A58A|nr:hypothetical protein [uncultured Corynebacterium sp.]
MARKIARTLTALSASVAIAMGGAGVASAADALGSLSGLFGGGSSGLFGGGSALGSSKPDLEVPQGKRDHLGVVGGPAWNVDVYKQTFGVSKVAPGAQVKVRVEIQGKSNNDTRVDEVVNVMPNGFKLTKVERIKAGLLGDAPAVLKQNEYAVKQNGGNTEVRVSWKDGLIFPQAPTVSPSKPVIVDFTYTAPSVEGAYKHGAGARVGSAIDPYKVFNNATPIVVAKTAAPAGSSSGSSSLSSPSALGSLGK